MARSLIGLSSMATRRLLSELVQSYAQATARCVEIEAVGGVDAARRIRGGEQLDIVILASGVIAKLAAEGWVAAGSQVDFVRSGIAIAVPLHAPAPSLGDAAAVKRAVLAAQTISYSSGPSGDHLQALWRDWGLGEVMAQKARQAPPGISVASVIAGGEAELGFQQLSELLDVPGIQVLGPLPSEIQSITTFSAAIARSSRKPSDARRFIDYIASSDTDSTKLLYGMEPTLKPQSPS